MICLLMVVPPPPFVLRWYRITAPRGQDGDGDSGVDLLPRGGDLPLLVCEEARTRLAQGREISHTLNARYSRSSPRRRIGSKLYRLGAWVPIYLRPFFELARRICGVGGEIQVRFR